MSIITPQRHSRKWMLQIVIPMGEYSTVVGIDGCPAGWVCFHVDLSSRKTTVKILASITELCGELDQTRLIAIDIPIGLPAKGARACDVAARRLLGKPRSSSVFPAPVRASLSAKTYEEACELSLRAHGKSLSKQAFELIPKIREVDDLMMPELQVSMFEVHPEVSFWVLNGRRPLRHKKHKSEGWAERVELLLPHFPAIQEHLAELDTRKSGQHDLLDAAAAAWTAECVARGVVAREFDRKGLRMEIVY